MPIIGAHVSTAGGISKAIENAEKIGAKAIQIFGSSPQQWLTKFPSPAEINNFLAAREKSGNLPVFLHAGYLVNLASSKKENQEKSIKNLAEHYKIAQTLNAEGLIFHLGSSTGTTFETGMKNLAARIKKVLSLVKGPSKLLLENSSGGGNKLGSTLKELAALINQLPEARTGICLDTAHAFEAGMIEYNDQKSVKGFFDQWDRLIGIDAIKAIHANDSKTPFDSKSDRHENIGQGYIGKQGFKNLAGEKRLKDKIWILEVPGQQDQGPDAENIRALASYF
ncbi:MAG: deoxyribonuclease IV [Parcubacteria group bacterium Gr01-1014_19]|nr:MAG: deoxyribonuclease IV [Parcubacteria group bacterium Gr01-1014_19]